MQKVSAVSTEAVTLILSDKAVPPGRLTSGNLQYSAECKHFNWEWISSSFSCIIQEKKNGKTSEVSNLISHFSLGRQNSCNSSLSPSGYQGSLISKRHSQCRAPKALVLFLTPRQSPLWQKGFRRNPKGGIFSLLKLTCNWWTAVLDVNRWGRGREQHVSDNGFLTKKTNTNVKQKPRATKSHGHLWVATQIAPVRFVSCHGTDGSWVCTNNLSSYLCLSLYQKAAPPQPRTPGLHLGWCFLPCWRGRAWELWYHLYSSHRRPFGREELCHCCFPRCHLGTGTQEGQPASLPLDKWATAQRLSRLLSSFLLPSQIGGSQAENSKVVVESTKPICVLVSLSIFHL